MELHMARSREIRQVENQHVDRTCTIGVTIGTLVSRLSRDLGSRTGSTERFDPGYKTNTI